MAVSKAAVSKIWNQRAERHRRAQEELLRVVNEAITDLAAQYKLRPVASVSGKQKEFVSFYDKALKYETEGRVESAKDCFKEIGDIVRARVICQTLSDVDRLRKLFDENKSILVGGATVFDVKDRTATGYRAVHVNAFVEVNEAGGRVAVPCEIQLHTSLQSAWGMYTHKDFYKGDDVPPLVRELMLQLSDLLHVADNVADELILEVERARAEKDALPPAA